MKLYVTVALATLVASAPLAVDAAAPADSRCALDARAPSSKNLLEIALHATGSADPLCVPDSSLDDRSVRDLALEHCGRSFRQLTGHLGYLESRKACLGAFHSLKRTRSELCALARGSREDSSAEQRLCHQVIPNATSPNGAARAYLLLLDSRRVDIHRAMMALENGVNLAPPGARASYELAASELAELDRKLADWMEPVRAGLSRYDAGARALAPRCRELLAETDAGQASEPEGDSLARRGRDTIVSLAKAQLVERVRQGIELSLRELGASSLASLLASVPVLGVISVVTTPATANKPEAELDRYAESLVRDGLETGEHGLLLPEALRLRRMRMPLP